MAERPGRTSPAILPCARVNDIVIVEERLIAATDVGVFRWTTQGDLVQAGGFAPVVPVIESATTRDEHAYGRHVRSRHPARRFRRIRTTIEQVVESFERSEQ